MKIIDYKKTAIITPDKEISYASLLQEIANYAAVMPKQSKVIIFSENSEQWIYAFFAVWTNKGVAVPVDASSTVDDVAYILSDCKPECVIVSKSTQEVMQQAIKQANVDTRLLVMDNIDEEASKQQVEVKSELTFGTTAANDIAIIIYTSGTTGSPKGVMLSYNNLEANIRAVADEVPIFNKERRTLILLPLHHVLPLMGCVIAPITRGGGVAICPTMSGPDIMAMLQKGKIAILIGVPRLWQTLYSAIKKKIDANGVTRFLFNMCAKANNRTLSRIIFSSVHKKMGGHLDYCVSGGAALDKEIGEGLRTLGLDVLEGYGMTETAPIITFTRPGDFIPGCAGKPLPSVTCKIVNGELLAKGPNVMLGYYNRPEETAAVIDSEGFIHTGDLARLDAEGRVYITGRSKEIIVLSNGKNVQPNEIEYKLEKFDNLVKEAAVTEQNDLLVAIIVPQRDDITEAELKEKVVQPYNATVENYKKIMRIVVYHGDLPRTKLDKLKRFQLKNLLNTDAPKAEKGANEDVANESPTLKAIRKYIEEEKKITVHATDHIETDLAFDSLDKVGLQEFIEKTFGVSINADNMASFRNIKVMADSIKGNGMQKVDTEKMDWHQIMTSESSNLVLPRAAFTYPLVAKSFKMAFRLNNSLKVLGTENIPKDGPCIIAPNHQSFLDGPLAVAGMKWDEVKNYYFYATEEHVQGAARRYFASRHNIILMEHRNLKNSILKMAEVLKQGKNLVIFPEGSRTHTGKTIPFKKTFAILAQELNVPIIPVCIRGAFDALPRSSTFPKPKHIEIEYLPAVQPDSSLTYEELAAKVRSIIDAKLKA